MQLSLLMTMMFGKSGSSSGGGMVLPTYTIPWENQFTSFTRDANGYTVLTPSATSQIAYVDATAGNDATARVYTSADTTVFNDPFTDHSPLAYKTLSAAMATRRSGQPDWVLLKKGETWISSASIYLVSGLSNTERQLIGSYGSSTIRPMIKVPNYVNGAVRLWNGVKFANFLGIELYSYQTDPSNFADYIGASNLVARNAFYCISTLDLNENILIEDCKVTHFSSAITNESTLGYEDIVISTDFIVRRNIIAYIHTYPTSIHSIGIWARNASMLVEDNIFYKCGWLMKAAVSETLSTALSAASETSITVSSIPVDAPTSGELEIITDSGASVYVKYSSFTGNTYTITSTDFSIDNASVGNFAEVAQSRADKFKHSMYMTSMQNSIIRTNISIAPSSIHSKMTSNPRLTSDQVSVLSTALTGMITSVTVDVIFANETAQTGNLLITLDDATVLTVAYTSWVGTTFTIVPTDFTASPASIGNSATVQQLQDYEYVRNIAVYSNIFVNGEIGTSYGGNQDNGMGFRFNTIYIQNNIYSQIGKNQNTNRTLGWAAGLDDARNSKITDELNIYTENGAVSNTSTASVVGYADHNQIYNNISKATNGGGIDIAGGSIQTNIDSYSNVTDLISTSFVDDTRTPLTYLGTLALPTTEEELASRCLSQSKDTWNPSYACSTIALWVRAGYALASSLVIFTDIVSATIIAGTTTTLTIDAVGTGTLSYQWFKDGVAISGATARSYTTDVINTGDSFVYRCDVTDAKGTVSSSNATVNAVATTLSLTLNGINSYMSIANTTINAGDLISFDSSFTDISANRQILDASSGSRVRVATGPSGDGGYDVSFLNIASLTIDGTAMASGGSLLPYADGALHTFVVTGIAGKAVDLFGILKGAISSPFAGVIKNITIDKTASGGGVTTWAIDSGSTTTEAPTVDANGIGNITFNNVVAGDWA